MRTDRDGAPLASVDAEDAAQRADQAEDLHDHAHEHAEDDPSIQLEGGLAHLEYHRAHPGYSHEHPHICGGGHTWDHHR